MTGSSNIPSGSCLDCRGRCCRSHYVWVTGYDIWRISTAQRLPPESFVVVGQYGGEPSPHGFCLDPNQETHYLTLDKKGRYSRFQPCVFLIELANGEGKCGVYPHRPAVCHAYPLSLMHGDAYVTRSASCPPGSLSQLEINQPALRIAPRRAYLELDLYAQVVAHWNSRIAHSRGEVYTLNEYFGYILNVFDALAVLEADTGVAEMKRVEESWPTPPRTINPLDSVNLSISDHPWFGFFLRANEVIGSFYPKLRRTRRWVPVAESQS